MCASNCDTAPHAFKGASFDTLQASFFASKVRSSPPKDPSVGLICILQGAPANIEQRLTNFLRLKWNTIIAAGEYCIGSAYVVAVSTCSLFVSSLSIAKILPMMPISAGINPKRWPTCSTVYSNIDRKNYVSFRKKSEVPIRVVALLTFSTYA
jgi:hypothetical protein